VILHGDGGGKAQAIGKPVAGRQRVAQLLAGLFRRGRPLGVFLRLAWVNGHPGAVMYDAEGLVISVIELDAGPDGEGAGAVQAIHAVVNPDKLRHLGPVSDVARLPGTDDLPARAGVGSASRPRAAAGCPGPAGRTVSAGWPGFRRPWRLRALPERGDRVRVVGQLV
jgi:hypothetical protein